MKQALIVDTSADVDILKVPKEGKWTVKLTASEPLVYNYEVMIWQDNTKKNHKATSNLSKNGIMLTWEIDCTVLELEAGIYYYEMIEKGDSNRRVLKGTMEVRE